MTHSSRRPATLNRFVSSIKEPQTKWFKLKNTSPIVSYEIVRSSPGALRFQYAVPTKRMERKVRTQLGEQIDRVELDTGSLRLPVSEGDTIGGGFLTTGRDDWHPLKTDFKVPAMNSVAASLHHHAMPRTKFFIQILFQPDVGRSPKRWLWNKRAYQHRNYLKKEKENLWGSVEASTREKSQAKQIEEKAGQLRCTTSIRLLVINGDEYTKSRLKEVAAGFNQFEDEDSGQYLNIETVRTLRKRSIFRFVDAVRQRRFKSWSRSFQTTDNELAGLLTLPDPGQDNITAASP